MDAWNNTTSFVCSYSYEFFIPITIIFVITALLVLFENILVCIAIISSPLRQIKSNFFLVGLAVADMFTSVTIVPLQILEVWSSPNWPLGAIGVNIYNSLWNFCLIVPFLTVLTITLDRYMVITRPSNLFPRFTLKWVIGILVFIWTYSIILVSLLSLSFDDPPSNEYVWNVPYQYYYPFLAVHILLPVIIICYCYLKILSTARSSQEQVSEVARGDPNRSRRQSEIKLAKTVGYVIMALVIVWTPVLGLEVVYALDSGHSCIVKQIGIMSVWITCTNGIVNPIIYSVRSRQFKDVFRKLACCVGMHG